MEISRDVTFDEEATLKRSRKCQHEEVYEEDVPPRNVEVAPSPENETSEDHDMLEPQEPPTMNISRKRKTRFSKRNYTRSREVWSSRRLHKSKKEIKSIFYLCSF